MKFWNISPQESTLEEIVSVAKELTASQKRWHFHILAPGCQLNDSGDFVLLLENTDDQQLFSVHATSKPVDAGKELVQLLHGKQVMETGAPSLTYKPSAAIIRMVDRAKQLNAQGKLWHHHMLFPDCKFNTKGKWTILFEDSSQTEELSSTSDQEPKEDLQQIETLFYQGKS